IVGKTRLALAPMQNHWWQATLYVTARGLSTSPVPCGDLTFETEFDFLDHRLVVRTSDGRNRSLPLQPQSVARFYRSSFDTLHTLGVPARIRHPKPNEVPNPVRCDADTVHASYDAGATERFRRALVQADRLLKEFRGRFIGKCSPVHFFWGS